MSRATPDAAVQLPSANLAFERARLAGDFGKWRTAIEILTPLATAPNPRPEALSLYGYALARAGIELETARSACATAVEMQSFVPLHHAHLGFVYQCTGLHRRARDCYAAALRLDQDLGLARDGMTALESASWLHRLRTRWRRLGP